MEVSAIHSEDNAYVLFFMGKVKPLKRLEREAQQNLACPATTPN